MGIPANQEKRERFGQKLGIIKEKNCTPGKLKTRKGDLGKKGYPGGLKPERAVQAKEGMKRTTASSMIVCAHDDLRRKDPFQCYISHTVHTRSHFSVNNTFHSLGTTVP